MMVSPGLAYIDGMIVDGNERLLVPVATCDVRMLAAVMSELADRNGWTDGYIQELADDDAKALTRIEAIVHEAAHAFLLGPAASSSAVCRAIGEMTDLAANAHERSALRVEFAVLFQLGVYVNLAFLASRAIWRRGRFDPPSLFDALSAAETACMDALLSVVEAAKAEYQRREPMKEGS